MASRYVPREPFLDRAGQLALAWWRYLSDLRTVPLRLTDVALATQGASIAATALHTVGAVQRGIYRLAYYQRVTRAATTSSELTTTFGWTDGGVAQTISGAVMNGNTTATQQTGTLLVRADKATTLTYATAYVSVGGTPMQYSLDITLEQLV